MLSTPEIDSLRFITVLLDMKENYTH
jgi:hypothetical protein